MKTKTYKPFPETDDLIWSECIRMHSDICTVRKQGYYLSKKAWLEFNGYTDWIALDCFFCHACQLCRDCPAAKVDSTFNCMTSAYDYAYYDGKFVTKLKELNTIRKGLKS